MVDVFALALAGIAFALSVWIVIPGPVIALFVLTVGTTELWPLFFAFNAVALAVAIRSRSHFRLAAISFSSVALLCTLLPPMAYAVAGPHVPIHALLQPQAQAGRPLAVDAPVVLTIYGGAWENGSPQKDAAFNAVVASWGYRVIPLDYRHAPAARWPAQLDDVLRQIDAIHAPRVALLGHSSGAQLALIAAARRQRVNAVITYESPVDLELGYAFPSQPDLIDARRVMSDLCGGSPQQRPACFHSASPRYAVHPGMPPVLMIAGGRDHVVNVDFEHFLRDSLRRDGVPVTYVELPWADHSFETVTMGFHSRIAFWYLRQFLSNQLKGR